MGTPRVYFGLHLYSTAWPIYDLAQTVARRGKVAFGSANGILTGSVV